MEGGWVQERPPRLLLDAVHPKLVPRYSEEFRESGLKRDFAEAISDCFKTEGVDLRISPSTKKPCVFVRDIADCCDEIEGYADNVDENWDFEKTVYVNGVAASEACEKLKEVQRICKDGGKAVLTFVIVAVELSREVAETKRNSTKLVHRANDLKRALKDVRFVERLAYVSLEVPSACMRTLEAQVKDADAKYAKLIGKTAQTEENLRSRISSLVLLPNAGRNRNAQLRKDCVDEVTRDKNVLAYRPRAYGAIRRQLHKRIEALREAREELTAAISEVKRLCLNAMIFDEDLSVSRADVALQSSLLEENSKQLQAKLVKFNEAQSQLELKGVELITLYDQQAKTTAELTWLRTQNAIKTAETVELEFVVTESALIIDSLVRPRYQV